MADSLIRRTMVFISSQAHLNLSFNLCECGVSRVLPGGSRPLEPDDTYRLCYLNRGTVQLEQDGAALCVAAGQGLLLLPDARGTLTALGEDESEVVWVTFTGYQVETYLARAGIFRSKPVFDDPDGEAGACINRIYQKSRQFPNRYCKMMVEMYQLFAYLLDQQPARKNETLQDWNADIMNYYAGRAVEFVDQNYSREITVGDMADALGVTKKRLYAVFSAAFHLSPKQYLIYYRMEKACKRLRSTSRTVQEIAREVGYSNQFYFSKEFKRLIGLPPTDYRRETSEHSEIFSYRLFAPALAGAAKEIILPVVEHLDDNTYEPLAPAQPGDGSPCL